MPPSPFKLRIGVPYMTRGALVDAAECAPLLVSAGGFWRDREGGFRRVQLEAWAHDVAIDSGGFVAMMQGGYRWDVSEYVRWVLTGAPTNAASKYGGHSVMPFPWAWWAAMDFCCEQEIAPDRAEVRRRMALTWETFAETCEEVAWHRGEGWGADCAPWPMPTLQGRTPADYLISAEQIAARHPDGGLPALVGLGSVCRRDLHGPEGLIPVLDALHEALPGGVRLHLFGVKGEALAHLGRWPGRMASADSMAWAYRARMAARDAGVPCDMKLKAATLREWAATNVGRL